VDVHPGILRFWTDVERSDLDLNGILPFQSFRRKGVLRQIQVLLKNNRGIGLRGFGIGSDWWRYCRSSFRGRMLSSRFDLRPEQMAVVDGGRPSGRRQCATRSIGWDRVVIIL